MSFECRYTSKPAQAAMVSSFQARGLKRSLARDASCIIQWSPYSKLNWNKALQGRLVVSSHCVHQALSAKATLFRILQAQASKRAQCETNRLAPITHGVDVSGGFGALRDLLAKILAANDGKAWVLKCSSRNNATAVFILSDASDIAPTLSKIEKQIAEEQTSIGEATHAALSKQWVVQEYVRNPMLLGGRKFHIRCNALVHGRLVLYLHRDYVAHLATERYTAGDWQNRWVHITNHGVQRHHPLAHTVKSPLDAEGMLSQLIADGCDKPSARKWMSCLWDRLCSAVRDVILALKPHRAEFFPLPNCFEVFGFDFLVEKDEENSGPVLRLLEVNSGPAMEGECHPQICRKLVEDTLRIVLDPVLTRVRSTSAGAIPPSSPPLPPMTAGHTAPVPAKAPPCIAPFLGVCTNIESDDNHYRLLWRGSYQSTQSPSTVTTATPCTTTKAETATNGDFNDNSENKSVSASACSLDAGDALEPQLPHTESVATAATAAIGTTIISATTIDKRTDTTPTINTAKAAKTAVISECFFQMTGENKRIVGARETSCKPADSAYKLNFVPSKQGKAKLWHSGYEDSVRKALELSKYREINL